MFNHFTKHLSHKETLEINLLYSKTCDKLIFSHLTIGTFWSSWHSSWKHLREGSSTFFLSCTLFYHFTKHLSHKETLEINLLYWKTRDKLIFSHLAIGTFWSSWHSSWKHLREGSSTFFLSCTLFYHFTKHLSHKETLEINLLYSKTCDKLIFSHLTNGTFWSSWHSSRKLLGERSSTFFLCCTLFNHFTKHLSHKETLEINLLYWKTRDKLIFSHLAIGTFWSSWHSSWKHLREGSSTFFLSCTLFYHFTKHLSHKETLEINLLYWKTRDKLIFSHLAIGTFWSSWHSSWKHLREGSSTFFLSCTLFYHFTKHLSHKETLEINLLYWKTRDKLIFSHLAIGTFWSSWHSSWKHLREGSSTFFLSCTLFYHFTKHLSHKETLEINLLYWKTRDKLIFSHLAIGTFWSSWHSSWKHLREGSSTFFLSCTLFYHFTKHLSHKETLEINLLYSKTCDKLIFSHLTNGTFWSSWHSSRKLLGERSSTFFLCCTLFNHFTKHLSHKETLEINLLYWKTRDKLIFSHLAIGTFWSSWHSSWKHLREGSSTFFLSCTLFYHFTKHLSHKETLEINLLYWKTRDKLIFSHLAIGTFWSSWHSSWKHLREGSSTFFLSCTLFYHFTKHLSHKETLEINLLYWKTRDKLIFSHLAIGTFWSSWHSSWKHLREGSSTFFLSCTLFYHFTKHLSHKETLEINLLYWKTRDKLIFSHLAIGTFWSSWHSSWKHLREGSSTFFLSCTLFNHFTKHLSHKVHYNKPSILENLR